MKDTRKPPTTDEEMCERIAEIIGEESAAAKALKDLHERRAAGLMAWIEYDGRTWFVGSGRKPDLP